MSNVDPEVLDLINTLAEETFALEVQLDGKNTDFKAAQAVAAADHNALIAPIQAQIDANKARLAEVIQAHRDQLVGSKRKSFATMIATFQFREVATKLKVTDASGLMDVARRLGIVRKIARQAVTWKLVHTKFATWWERNGEHHEALIDFVEPPTEGESLSMKPNGTYTVVHDGNRISPPSVTIKKS